MPLGSTSNLGSSNFPFDVHVDARSYSAIRSMGDHLFGGESSLSRHVGVSVAFAMLGGLDETTPASRMEP